ncbi:MAG: serine--tRNA ligase, partial [Thermoleophilaceae bacterium]|nr:serine--tRNA ligase [Thermoleophilaceae bacterium]
MLDLKALRSDPDGARAALARRGGGASQALDQVLELDARRRALLPELEERRAAKNAASKRIGELQREGGDTSAAIAEVKEASGREKELDAELSGVQGALDAALLAIPNPPDESAAGEDTVLREVGEPGASGRDHLELLEGLIDLEAGARVAGSRFAYLKGPLVMLELALVRWALETLAEKGFEAVLPPVLVREEALRGTGFLPDTEQQIYRLPEDDLYL